MWTKDFKDSPPQADDVEEDEVEIPFEKELCLVNETSAEQLRVSTTPRSVKPKTLDQLEEWMKEKPIPYISNDKFSQEVKRLD